MNGIVKKGRLKEAKEEKENEKGKEETRIYIKAREKENKKRHTKKEMTLNNHISDTRVQSRENLYKKRMEIIDDIKC